jgi:hypothetical protein
MRAWRGILLATATLLAPCFVGAQSEPPRDPNVVLQVAVVGGDRPFHVGETISLELAFSSALASRYEVNMATYDRSGRMEYERFAVTPADGVVDPLASGKPGYGGGITSFNYLSKDPWTIVLHLNEWVRFTRPGRYDINITSRRVGVKDESRPGGTAPITVAAPAISLTIVPATPEWQQATHDASVAALNRPPPAGDPMDTYRNARLDALNALRFLGTVDATRELGRWLRPAPFGNTAGLASLGLLTSPERDVARQTLEAALTDPDREIDSTFEYTLQELTANGRDPERNRQARQRIVETLVAALPNKRGPALTTTLATLVNDVWNGAPLPASTTDALVTQFVGMFDQLPADQQRFLLAEGWDRVARPALLPAVKRLALADDASLPPNKGPGAAREVSALALRRWYEMDPAAARSAVIAEITRAPPRFHARELGFLPDETLPTADAALADHFEAGDESARVASLIARYASGAILDRALATIDPKLGRWACDIQGPILAFALRTDPAKARPRLEQALAGRGEGFSHCYDQLLSSVAAIHYDAVLETIATKQLDDPEVGARSDAVNVLGQYGSSRAEALLLDHFRQWSQTWAAREAELNPAFSDRGVEREGVESGYMLARALATGSAWLSDTARLDVLAALARGARVRNLLEGYRQRWTRTPFVISIDHFPTGTISARVVQYEVRSLEALEQKLAQFPAGTPFTLAMSGRESPWTRDTATRLRSFLTARAMIVVDGR